MNIKTTLQQLLSAYVPTIKITSNALSPWFTTNLKHLLNKKKRPFAKAKRSGEDYDRSSYRLFSTRTKSEIKKAKKEFFGPKLSLLRSDPRKFWKAINPSHGRTDPVFIGDDSRHMNDSEAADLLNSFFSSIFTEENFPLPPVSERPIIAMSPIKFSSDGIMKIIETLPTNSAPGEDSIPGRFLTMIKGFVSPLFSDLFQVLDSRSVPPDWRSAIVKPIFKSGDASNSSNYRPIFLNSVSCKLMEHVIFTNIMAHLDQINFFFTNQHSFRKNYSCNTQLFDFVHDLHLNTHAGAQTDITFIDFAKAFDTVPYARLISKLRHLQI